jgi:uncharacterized protein (DUF427 family)
MSGAAGHRVEIQPSHERVRVMFAGEEVADTRRALILRETGLPPRHYIPPEDVRQDFLTATPTHTRCPYKGEASYWSLRANGRTAEDAVWGYLEPIADCAAIKGYFCFYPERVDRIEIEAASAG